MIKRFCDVCGAEITDENKVAFSDGPERLRAEVKQKGVNGNSLVVQVMTALNNTSNDGDFCKYCILDALYKLDDRPQIAP